MHIMIIIFWRRMMKNELIKFKSRDGKVNLEVKFDGNEIWLNRQQISELFDRDIKTIGKHINNALKEELSEDSTVAKYATVQIEGIRKIKRNISYYSIDMILSVGYRVKSKKGTEFRKQANSVLKDYLLKGYAINDSKLKIPNLKEITLLLDNYRKMDGLLPLSGNDLLEFMIAYNRGLTMLDDYDHQSFKLPEGRKDTYRIEYKECLDIIRKSKFTGKNDNFGKERDQSFDSSISTIYQTFDGAEL